MSHAVYAHNIQHVIVDNLQFMLGCTNILDGYSAQNQAIGALRRFASAEDVHVTVVIHPRKVSGVSVYALLLVVVLQCVLLFDCTSCTYAFICLQPL